MAILGQDAMEDDIAFYTEQAESCQRLVDAYTKDAATWRLKAAAIEATIARVKQDAQERYGQYMRQPEIGPDQGAG